MGALYNSGAAYDTNDQKSIIATADVDLEYRTALERSKFTAASPGRLVPTVEDAWAFVPDALPPALLVADWETASKASEAENALGRLEGVARDLPNPYLLIGPLQKREAIVSSRIEGTFTTARQLVLYEAGELATAASSDTREVHNYIRALQHGLRRLPKLPVSLRLIREMHRILLEGVRGHDNRPGNFRDQQNAIGHEGQKIGEARFVPPPPGRELDDALDAFEKFIHAEDALPLLVRMAMIHYQFEAIHPFFDGNGRVGRILNSLLLCSNGRLSQPLLYLSSYFEHHRDAYVDHMLAVSQRGEWIPWIRFFLQGVIDQCEDALGRAKRILALRDKYKKKMEHATGRVHKLIDELCASPATTIQRVAEVLGITFRAASQIVEKLVTAQILVEITGRPRDRVFLAKEIVAVIER
jgi:Fic family protein